MNKTFALIACGLFFLPGCTSKAPVRIAVSFDAAKARAMLAPGSNQVSGRIMVQLASGTLVSCAGSVVSLVPATPYAKEWARIFYELDSGKYGSINSAFRMDARESPVQFAGAEAFYSTTKTSRCDEDGDFQFNQVGNGEYLIVAKTRWLGRDHDYYDFMYGVNDAQEEDGSVMQKVRLQGGDSIDLQWTPPRPGLLGGEGLPGAR